MKVQVFRKEQDRQLIRKGDIVFIKGTKAGGFSHVVGKALVVQGAYSDDPRATDPVTGSFHSLGCYEYERAVAGDTITLTQE